MWCKQASVDVLFEMGIVEDEHVRPINLHNAVVYSRAAFSHPSRTAATPVDVQTALPDNGGRRGPQLISNYLWPALHFAMS